MDAQFSHGSACQPCAQTVAHNYTWKLGLALWVCLDPLLAYPPHLHTCDSHAILLAWYHPRLLLWFWYFSPVRRNLKGNSHAHFYCPYLFPFPGILGQCRQRISVILKCGQWRSWSSAAIAVLSIWLLSMRIYGYPRCDTPFEKAAMQVSDNQSDNKKFGEVHYRTPITGLSFESKSVRFGSKEVFSNDTNAGNRPTGVLLRERASITD